MLTLTALGEPQPPAHIKQASKKPAEDTCLSSAQGSVTSRGSQTHPSLSAVCLPHARHPQVKLLLSGLHQFPQVPPQQGDRR